MLRPSGNAWDPGSQRGAALAFVLALLVIVGIMVGLTWRGIRSDNSIAAMDRGDIQARLLALAGADYALAKVGPPGPRQDLRYGSDSLNYRLADSGRSFDLSVRTWGLFARVKSTGRYWLPRPGTSREYRTRLGQALHLNALPAVGLLNHEGNMVLAGAAQVSGVVMLWRGDVRKATDYNVRYTGRAGLPVALDSLAPAWKLAAVDFGRADAWMREQERFLSARDFSGDGDFDSGMVKDLRLPDSAFLTDTTLASTRILAGQVLRVGSGARLSDCKLVAGRILIEGDASLRNVLAYAARTLRLEGGRIQGGQYLAGDTLRIASGRPLEGFPVFYTQGRMSNRGKPDSAQVGLLELAKASGEGLFFSACKDHPPFDQDIRLHASADTHLTGLLFTPCYASVEGHLRGSLLCQNLKFEYHGTIWLGHLKDAVIEASPLKGIPAPLLFPGLAPALFPQAGP